MSRYIIVMFLTGLSLFLCGGFMFKSCVGFPNQDLPRNIWEQRIIEFKRTEITYYMGFGMAVLGVGMTLGGALMLYMQKRFKLKRY